MAYRLRLPVDSKIHDVFHVSLLRPFIQSSDVPATLPDDFRRHHPLDSPVRATDKRVVLVNRIPQEQWLVQWSSSKSSTPTWESVALLKTHFPHLHLEDKVLPMGGRVDRELTPQPNSDATAQLQQPLEDVTQAQEETEAANEDPEPTRPSSPRMKSPKPVRRRTRPSKYKDYVSH